MKSTLGEPAFLREARFFKLLTHAYFYAYVPIYFFAILFSIAAIYLSSDVIESEGANIGGHDFVTGLFLIAFIAPVLETAILVSLVLLWGQVLDKNFHVALVVAVIFGLMHGYISVVFGIVQVWPFFVQSYFFSVRRSIKVASAISGAHMLNNLLMIGFYWGAESL